MSSAAQVDTVFFPELKITSTQLEADENNNLIVESEAHFNQGNHQFTAETSTSHYDYNGQSRVFRGVFNEGTSFAPGHPFLLQFDNNTNDQTMLDFRTSYYSLFDGEGQELGSSNLADSAPRNIVIQSGLSYGFILNLNDTQQTRPIFLKIFTDSISGGTTYTMNIRIIDANGAVTSTNFGMSHHVDDYIPVVPKTNGEHYVFIRTFSTVILRDVTIIDDPIIESTPNGFSEVLTGQETIGKFIRIDADAQRIFNLKALFTTNAYLGGLPYLGTLAFRVFSPTSSILGSTLGTTSILISQPIYVSVVAIPPDETDPAIQGAKSDANIPEGMELEYTIVAEAISISELPLDQDFTVKDITRYSVSGRYFSLDFETDVLLAMNATTFQSTSLIPSDTNLPWISINSNSNDVLNSNAHFAVVPAGLYILALSIGAVIRFTVFNPMDMDQGEMQSLDIAEGEYNLLKLTTEMFGSSLFNSTFTNMNNQSTLMSMTGYNQDGTFSFMTTMNFSHYHDIASNLVENNFSSFNTGLTTGGYYVLLQHLQSWRYLANGSSSTNFTDDARLNLDISRQSYYSFLNQQSNNTNFFRGTLEDEYSHTFEDTTPSVSGYLTIHAEEMTAYRLVIDTTNVTIASALLYSHYNRIWYNTFSNQPTMINNETHYILELVFATTVALTLGLSYILGNPLSTSQLVISLETIDIQQLPALELQIINILDQGEGIIPIFSRPLTYVVIVAVIVAAFFLRRRFAVTG